MQGLAAKGALHTLTNDQLKKYLKLHGLRLGGKKDELVERITDHVDSKPRGS